MRCVASWSFQPFFTDNGSRHWSQVRYLLASTIVSIEQVAKIYTRPVVYTDARGKEIFSALTDKADFIDVYSNVFDTVPPNVWSYCKLLTYADQTQPYFHFDLDFICLKHFGEKFNCDIMFQKYENILDTDCPGANPTEFYNVEKVGHLYQLPDIFKRPDVNSIYAANLGCLFMNNMALNKEYADIAINLVQRNLDVLRSEHKLNICEIEQHTLGLLLHDRKDLKINTLTKTSWHNTSYNEYFIHFIGRSKGRFLPWSVKFQDQLMSPKFDDKLIYYAKELVNEKISLNGKSPPV